MQLNFEWRLETTVFDRHTHKADMYLFGGSNNFSTDEFMREHVKQRERVIDYFRQCEDLKGGTKECIENKFLAAGRYIWSPKERDSNGGRVTRGKHAKNFWFESGRELLKIEAYYCFT